MIWHAARPTRGFKPPSLCLPSSMVSSVITSSSEKPSLGFESDSFRTSPEFLGIFKAAHRRVFFFSSALTFQCYQPPELVACVGRRVVNGLGMWCSTHLTLSLISTREAAVSCGELFHCHWQLISAPKGAFCFIYTLLIPLAKVLVHLWLQLPHFLWNPFCLACSRQPRASYSSLLCRPLGSPSPPAGFGKSLLWGGDSSRCVLHRMLMGRGSAGAGSNSPRPKFTPTCPVSMMVSEINAHAICMYKYTGRQL